MNLSPERSLKIIFFLGATVCAALIVIWLLWSTNYNLRETVEHLEVVTMLQRHDPVSGQTLTYEKLGDGSWRVYTDMVRIDTVYVKVKK